MSRFNHVFMVFMVAMVSLGAVASTSPVCQQAATRAASQLDKINTDGNQDPDGVSAPLPYGQVLSVKPLPFTNSGDVVTGSFEIVIGTSTRQTSYLVDVFSYDIGFCTITKVEIEKRTGRF